MFTLEYSAGKSPVPTPINGEALIRSRVFDAKTILWPIEVLGFVVRSAKSYETC